MAGTPWAARVTWATAIILMLSPLAGADFVASYMGMPRIGSGWGPATVGDAFYMDGVILGYETTDDFDDLEGLNEFETLYGLTMTGVLDTVDGGGFSSVGSWSLYRYEVCSADIVLETGQFEMEFAYLTDDWWCESMEVSGSLTADEGVASPAFPFDLSSAASLSFSGLYDTGWGGLEGLFTAHSASTKQISVETMAVPIVPEPATASMMGIGMSVLVVGLVRRRRVKS